MIASSSADATSYRASPISPQDFSLGRAGAYFSDPAAITLAEFFDRKGLAALKEEDRRETWYRDWIAFQAEHRIYARLLSPADLSHVGGAFDLLRYARFLELFAHFSPAHGYSLQVTFLGLFPILMGENDALKREAIASLEAGGILALGVSEKHHGADLLGNEFTVTDNADGRLIANGSKYYIGNCNAASMITMLSRYEDARSAGRTRRAPFVLFALRPALSPAFTSLRKISTLGIRSAYVGEFSVNAHELPRADLIAQGRAAWDAVFGTVTLGKFFLGFGSIGICQHAFHEAAAHLTDRILYGKPALQMSHLRAAMTEAYARLAAMKLYAYRALDYVHAAAENDRRYLLFCAVQKAKVSTEGVKVMALISQCVGAKGFEGDTYIEMALRDAQLIPGLEGSAHINLGLTSQFMARYFGQPDRTPPAVPSLTTPLERAENPYLMRARTGAIHAISFPPFLRAYRPWMTLPNVRLFVAQARALRLICRSKAIRAMIADDEEISIGLGECQATLAYGQLIAENASLLPVPPQIVSVIFHHLVQDLSISAQRLASSPRLGTTDRDCLGGMMCIPRTSEDELAAVAMLMAKQPE